MSKELWVEKYRPNTVDGYVFRDDKQERQVKSWIEDGGLPHVLFSGTAGIGKTTLVRLLLNELKVDSGDILELNGSAERGIDVMRDKITDFVQLAPWGDYRYVFIDEADYLTPDAQASLRNLMEVHSGYSRFLLTCNHPERIIPQIHSRSQGFHFTKLDRKSFELRVAEILITENVEFDIDLLDSFVSATYPDMRKCINNLQLSVVDSKLQSMVEDDSADTADYKIQAIELFKKRKYTEARKIICQNARPDEYEGLFTFAYQNLDLWADGDPGKKDQAIVAIRNGMAKAPLCADQEINIAALFTELSMIALN